MIWPPDIFSGKANVLATGESESRMRFKVVQFWSWDFYTTQLEQINPNGTVDKAVIDCDDNKQWSCSLQIVESESKLIITLGDGSPPIEYSWERKWFILPPGQHRARP